MMTKKKIRILAVIESFGSDQYGAAQVVIQLADFYQQHEEISYRILSAQLGKIPDEHLAHVRQVPAGKSILTNNKITYRLRWHPGMRKFIQQQIDDFAPDIVHMHGTTTPLSRETVNVAALNNIPVLLTAHGTISPWLWRYKGWAYFILKTLYWKILQRPSLRKAGYVHAITQNEARDMLREFPDATQILIPNALDLQSIIPLEYKTPEHYFLFVGRLHPKKGVALLLQAFIKASLPESWRLAIIGPDFDPQYSLYLRSIVSKANFEDRVSFLGPIFDNRKYELMQKAWAAVVPSFSEVIALTNLEAASVRTPTITTLETGVEDWDKHGGLIVKPEVEELTRALEQAASWGLEERLKRGQQIQEWVENSYNWNTIGPKWLNAYQQIIERDSDKRKNAIRLE
jgi:glycosyltransferase involved in cell wall biosynthesis